MHAGSHARAYMTAYQGSMHKRRAYRVCLSSVHEQHASVGMHLGTWGPQVSVQSGATIHDKAPIANSQEGVIGRDIPQPLLPPRLCLYTEPHVSKVMQAHPELHDSRVRSNLHVRGPPLLRATSLQRSRRRGGLYERLEEIRNARLP
jgi:hypothetical protein